MADGDILDFLNNNWSSLLGMNNPTASVAGLNGGMPPAPAPSMAPPTGAPPQAPPPPPSPQGGVPQMSPQDMTAAAVGTGMPPAPPMNLGPGATPGAPTPATAPQAAPSLPPAMSAPGAPRPPQNFDLSTIGPGTAGPPGMPQSLAPPGPGGPPPQIQGAPGDLARTLGINYMPKAPSPWENAIASGMAGLGKGLSAVGSAPRNASGAQSFAAGMGGAITGASNFTQQQKQELFQNSSAAFKDMIAAQNQNDVEGYRKAQAAYLSSRAQAIQTGGTATGTNAWQNTPYGKTIQVENEAQKYEKGQQIILQKRWAMNSSTPEQQQDDLDNLQKQVNAYRGRLYKQAGIDPNTGSKLLNQGTSADQPFSTKGMTLDQFNSQVPMGAWFTDQNGVVRQRTVAPPGGTAPPAGTAAPGTSPGQQMQDYNDTSMALQPAQ